MTPRQVTQHSVASTSTSVMQFSLQHTNRALTDLPAELLLHQGLVYRGCGSVAMGHYVVNETQGCPPEMVSTYFRAVLSINLQLLSPKSSMRDVGIRKSW